MFKLPFVLAIFMVGSAASGRAAEPAPGRPTTAAASPAALASAEIEPPADLRLGLAFWLPVYYGIFVWLLTNEQPGGGGARRRVEEPRLARVAVRATEARTSVRGW
jgi:hypothetical protein